MPSKPSFLYPLRPALKTAVAASVVALVMASAGCAATPEATYQAKPGETAQAFYQGLLAELSSLAEDFVQAHALMLNLARISNDPQAYERATEFALRSRDGDTALMTARARTGDGGGGGSGSEARERRRECAGRLRGGR